MIRRPPRSTPLSLHDALPICSIDLTPSRSKFTFIASQRSGRRSRLMQTLKGNRSEEHTSELQSPDHLVCRLLLEKKKQRMRNRLHSSHDTTHNSLTIV